jgi:NAD(P)H-hydrate epimerase
VDAYLAADIRAAERPLLDAGVPLMARAAAGLARELRAFDGPLLVLAGSGDNGGDALFAAAELATERPVRIITTGDRVHERGMEMALAAGATRHDPREAAVLADGAVVVDGILGIGSTGRAALRGPARELVAVLIPLAPATVAVDLPSGVDPDTGEVPDPTVLRATTTVTFGALKPGLLRRPGADYAGRVVLIDIGLDLRGFRPVPPPG